MFLLLSNDNHILNYFTEGFENLLSRFFFSSENQLLNIGHCMWLHLYFPFENFYSDIRNKMVDTLTKVRYSLRGAIQTHCATLNVDSALEIWTPTPLLR